MDEPGASDPVSRVASLLHEAGELHHHVYRIVDGEDPDWASWYADWLISLSELPEILKGTPVRSELVYMLVKIDRDFTSAEPGEPWEQFYARELLEHFKPAAAPGGPAASP
jgi:hypothetical protein